MRLAFIDIIGGYTAARPDINKAMGGMTTAICFLAREMVKQGIRCSLVNAHPTSSIDHGVETIPLTALHQVVVDESYTAFIFCGRWADEMVATIRRMTKRPLLAWMHESSFTLPQVTPLPAFDAVAYVSDWHREINQPYALKHWRQTVMRNAMHPSFAALFAKDETIVKAKTRPPVIAYTGDFVRGAVNLPAILPLLKHRWQDFTCEIYAEMPPATTTANNYETIFKQYPCITHIGKIGQTELAQRLKRAALLAAPNPYPETSCINLIQAMAAGLRCIISNRAALPETAHGFASVVPVQDATDPIRADIPMPHAEFAKAIEAELDVWPPSENKLQQQRDFYLLHYQWSQRVAPWRDFIAALNYSHCT